MKIFGPPLLASLQTLPSSNSRAQEVSAGAGTRLVDGAGERKLTLSRYTNGTVEVVVSPPPPTQLVLSGGGAKGIAFPGVIQALETDHKLKAIQVISGSSAGAISAALLASGMNAEAFDTLSDNINLPDLLNTTNHLGKELQKASTLIGKGAGHVPKIGKYAQPLWTLLPRLQSKAAPLEELLRSEARKSILAHIAHLPRDTRTASVMAIADKLGAGGATTFRDLDVLSQHIPEIKRLNITGTGMFNGRPQLVVFNASLTPDKDIARAAHISGSLPIVFEAPVEEGLAFQENDEKSVFKDGGLLLNTPVSDLYERSFPESGLDTTENLIIKFESGQPKAPLDRGGKLTGFVDLVTGVAHTAAHELQEAKIKAFCDQTVTLPLNTDKGDFRGKINGTINFTMPIDVKNHLQALAQAVVHKHLENRAAVREHHQFASLDQAVLAMDDAMLASAMPALKKDPASTQVLQFRQLANGALQAVDTAITEANQAPALKLTPQLGAALRNLDALASSPEQIKWLGIKLNTAENRNYQQLLQAMAKEPGQGANLSKVLTSALSEMKKRDIAVIADNITREVIYPSLYRSGQPDANIALLRHVEESLSTATSACEVNQALDSLIDNYTARNKPWKQQLSSTTVEMAKAWRIPT